MKNWKVPAVILPLLGISGFLTLDSLNQSMDAVLFNGLLILWLMAMITTIFWLLIGLSWKRTKIKLMSSELMKNWRIPGIVLILLILAMTFRWSAVSSHTTTSAVLKHVQDNWNGAVYEQRYPTKGGYSEMRVKSPSDLIWFDSQDLTIAWGVMAAGSTLWLLYAVSKIKKKNANENT